MPSDEPDDDDEDEENEDMIEEQEDSDEEFSSGEDEEDIEEYSDAEENEDIDIAEEEGSDGEEESFCIDREGHPISADQQHVEVTKPPSTVTRIKVS